MNRDRTPIIINLACGFLAAVFLVFTMFAFSTHAAGLGILTLVLFLAVCIVWIWALKSVHRQVPASAGGDEAEAVALQFSRLKPKSFRDQIRVCQKQLARLQEKTMAMDQTLHDAFGDSTISIDRFMTGVRRARMLFLANQKQIADRILIFDEEGYRAAVSAGSVPETYQDTFAFIEAKIRENEEILTRIDELNARVQQLTNLPRLEDRSAMRQLDELIEQSGLYGGSKQKTEKEMD